MKLDKPLFIYEMANNHMGDIEHGLNVIRAFKEVSKDFDYNFGFKFQFRDLDTLIHDDFKDRMDLKYIKRFSETRLDDGKLMQLREELDKAGFVSICTPFDNASIQKIVDFKFDYFKIASCSFGDWPLIEEVAQHDIPIIASTAGAELDMIDRVVSYFEHRKKEFAIMHCIGEYPTVNANLHLNQIGFLNDRFKDVTIGYSTHENPDNTEAVGMAISLGAQIFERHVGLPTDKYENNGYSSNPTQIGNWLAAAARAHESFGTPGSRYEFSEKERNDLQGLKRGVFASATIKAGEKVTADKLKFHMPSTPGQVVTNDLSKYLNLTAKTDIEPNKAVMWENCDQNDIRAKVLDVVNEVCDMLKEHKIHVPHEMSFELSHHFGLDKIRETGAVIVNCINRSYCKKLIIQFPGQAHPYHFHKEKEETFQVLAGECIIDLGDGEKTYYPGDIQVVERGVNHAFRTETGAIFEEVSTTHIKGDSYYADKSIMENQDRKTEMTFRADWINKPLI